MTEDRFEQIIRDAARDYNRPPEITPREEMWARIQDAQKATAVAPVLRVERGGASAPQRSYNRSTPWWGLAAAAGILLAAGIGIGRSTASKPVQVVASTQTSTSTQPPTSAAPSPSVEIQEPVQEPGDAIPASIKSLVKPSADELSSVPSPKSGSRRPVRTQLDAEANRMSATYQLASVRHLAETELLLTTFQSDSANRAMDPFVAKWSRDLLSNTRLLLDSPAARDPLRKHLLEDLELVLTQIVQLSNTPNANERDMVESTIKEGHVMTRLRTAIPAGRPQGT